MREKGLRWFQGEGLRLAMQRADNIRYDPHTHDEYVISCNLAGNERAVLDGCPLQAPQGSITLYNPGQIQAGEGTRCILSLYLDPDFFACEQLASDEPAFATPLIFDPRQHERFRNLACKLDTDGETELLEEMALAAVVDLACSHLDRRVEEAPGANDWRVRRLQELLLDKLGERVTLAELAAEVGMSRVSVVRLFDRCTGVPPLAWQRVQRLRVARSLLERGMRPVEVACSTGFFDQAHLNRHFRRAYGITPARFARLARG